MILSHRLQTALSAPPEPAMDQGSAPAEIRGDQVAEAADQVAGDAPADELRQPEPQDRAARDQPPAPSCPCAAGGASLPAPSGRCICTVSTHRPSLKPTARRVPAGWKPRLR